MAGDVYHVGSLVVDRRVVFASASRYGMPPMAVAHEGGIFVTRTLGDGDPTAAALEAINAQLLDAFGLPVDKRHHAGLIVSSPDDARVGAVVDAYAERFYADFHASAPPPARATD